MKTVIFLILLSVSSIAYSQQSVSSWRIIPSSDGRKSIISYDTLNSNNFLAMRCEDFNPSNLQIVIITEKITVYNWEFEVKGEVTFDSMSTSVNFYPSKNQKGLFFDAKNLTFIIKEGTSSSIIQVRVKTSFKNGYYDFKFELKGLKEALKQLPCAEKYL